MNEDYLFDVDIEERELAPTYWLGPIYEGMMRNGSKPKSVSSTDSVFPVSQYVVGPGSSARVLVSDLVKKILPLN